MKSIAIIGGGPSGLFVFKRLINSGARDLKIDIFEKKAELGSGMPYSKEGSNVEHITNVSGNEIPELHKSLTEWIQAQQPETLNRFQIEPNSFHDYQVLPRLLFGQYLSDQFDSFVREAKARGLSVTIHRNSFVTDISDDPKNHLVEVYTENEKKPHLFDYVVICTGHIWPAKHEGKVPGYFDSPYPPAKLAQKVNFPVAIRGSSLSAIDAVRTLARENGKFEKDQNGEITYQLANENEGFKIVLHSKRGLLPAVRFHLEDSQLGKDKLLSDEEIQQNKNENEGFLSLDFVFTKIFKKPIKEKDPAFYEKIENMNMEEVVHYIMELREDIDPFDLFEGEYLEAEKSIQRKKSVYWKEMLGILSFGMNYPAKYFSAEDMLRLNNTLKPLISVVIAYVPQSSVEEMLAVHKSGHLELISVGEDSFVKPGEQGGAIYTYSDSGQEGKSVFYKMYIDAVGQPPVPLENFPFKCLVENKTVSQAKIKFRDFAAAMDEKKAGNKQVIIDERGAYLNVQGIAINDHFQVLDEYGAFNERIFMMAVPYISGYNPDYSGLDFCETASNLISTSILKNLHLEVKTQV